MWGEPSIVLDRANAAFSELNFLGTFPADEPLELLLLHLRGLDYEVAVAKQLGYNDECMGVSQMPEHFPRMIANKFHVLPRLQCIIPGPSAFGWVAE